MAANGKRIRNHAAELQRRNELARARGFTNRSAERRAKGGRNYVAERERREVLARERGYSNAYAERKAKSPITQSSKWKSYTDLYPRVADRTVKNADLFLSGFGTMGKTGVPYVSQNGHHGFHATDKQKQDRLDFEKLVEDEAMEKYNTVFDNISSADWWALWREEYALEYS